MTYELEEFIDLLGVMNSVDSKVVTNKTVGMFYKKSFHLFILHPYFSIRIKLSWNFGDNINLPLKLKSKLGLYHVVLTTL